jgi:DNA-binding transcriptional ArsR family regulator
MARTTDPDAQFLQALADPARLSIVRLLASQPEVCACDFTDCCNVGQPTVSHHLKVLRDAGIVTSERRGIWVYYRIAPGAPERLAGIARSMVPGGLIPVEAVTARMRKGQPRIDALASSAPTSASVTRPD